MAAGCEARHARSDRDLLRFLTCGSVDDGKSTLIGRLLHDCALIFDDQLETLEREFKTLRHDREAISIFRCCSTGWRTSGSSA